MNEININELLIDYEFDQSIMTETSMRLLNISDKWNNLSKTSKTIIVLYAELGSYRKVGKVLGISHSTCARFVKMIQEELRC